MIMIPIHNRCRSLVFYWCLHLDGQWAQRKSITKVLLSQLNSSPIIETIIPYWNWPSLSISIANRRIAGPLDWSICLRRPFWSHETRPWSIQSHLCTHDGLSIIINCYSCNPLKYFRNVSQIVDVMGFSWSWQ